MLLLLLGWGSAAPARAEGGIISTPRTGPIGVWSGETLTIENGGSVTSTGGATGVLVQTGGTLNITGGSVSAETNAVNLWDGTLNMTSGSVSSSQAAAVSGATGSTATISGGTVSGHFQGVIVFGTATISGGSVSAETGVYVHAGGTATISGGLVSNAKIGDNSTLNITGGSVPYGIEIFRDTGSLNLTGGSVTGGLSNVWGGTATISGCNLAVANGVLTGTLLYGTTINTPVFGPLTFDPPQPLVTTDPASQTICAGNSVSFTATATGRVSGAPTVQWQVSSGGSAFSDIPGATAATLTFTAAAADDGNQYRAVFTDGCNPATTSAAALTVGTSPPSITTCPPAQKAMADGSCQAAVPNFTAGVVASSNCSAVTITQDPTAGTLVGLGPHTITLTATDAASRSSTCTTTLTVLDTTAPTITCPGNQTVQATSASGALLPFTVGASDNCGSASTECKVGGAVITSPYTFPLGPTTVNCTATDAAGNTQTCSFTVTVVPVADLSVTASADLNPVATGSNLTYTITVQNAGPQPAQGVVLTDLLPAGTSFASANRSPSVGTLTTPKGNSSTVSWSVGTLAKGDIATLTVVVKVSAKAGATIANTASVSSSSPQDPTPGNNSALVSTTVKARR